MLSMLISFFLSVRPNLGKTDYGLMVFADRVSIAFLLCFLLANILMSSCFIGIPLSPPSIHAVYSVSL